MTRRGGLSRLPAWFGRRRGLVLVGFLLLFLGCWVLDLGPSDLQPTPGGLQLAREFFASALTPAFTYQGEVPASAEPYWQKVFSALWLTLRYAFCAVAFALILGAFLGLFGSRSWWSRSHPLLHALRWSCRGLAVAFRSVHELLWALLLLAAFGTSSLVAVLAIALPFGGTLGKVFSEQLDEQDEHALNHLRATGRPPFGAWWVGLFPRAFPDLLSYLFYRLECAIRSSAVLGFLGIPTLGYHLSTAYEDGNYGEVWTLIYLLLLTLAGLEWWGAKIRASLTSPDPKPTLQAASPHSLKEPAPSPDTLWQERPRNSVFKWSIAGATALVALLLLTESQWLSKLSPSQRSANLDRFLIELTPFPVRESGDWSAVWPWAWELLTQDGFEALHRTFHLGTSAIILAAGFSLLSLPFTSRSLTGSRFLGFPLSGSKAFALPLGKAFRGLALVARSFPEYILAFLFLQIFGPTAWPLILALALHNWGIMSRLNAEMIDNQRCPGAEVVFLRGGTRLGAFFTGWVPTILNRFLLFVFYRWETCIREATVLGMLGVASLGFLIAQEKARQFYDELFFFVLLGALLVASADLLSDWIRRKIKQP